MSLNDFQYRDTLSSTEILERIEELEELEDEGRSLDDDYELEQLKELASEAETYSMDWEDGTILVNDSHFEAYIEEEVSEIYDINTNAFPFYCIDWQRVAEEAQYDWNELTLGESTFWIR